MKKNAKLLITLSAFWLPLLLNAQSLTDFESFTAPGANGGILFRTPNISGSTSTKLEATNTLTAQVLNTGIPAGNPNAGNNALLAAWNFVDSGGAPLWLRLTTFNTAALPNPTITLDAGTALRFDLWSDHPVFASILVRETETGAAFGANGGSTGNIEFLGGNPGAASGNRGISVPASTWTTLTFEFQNPSTTPVFSFTGNGVLDPGADGKGVLEALGLAFDDVTGNRDSTINIWVDNFSVVNVPEPGTVALLLLGGGAVAIYARSRRKN